MAIDDANPSRASQRLTPWLAGAERPTRAGVYRRRFPGGPYACWDGAAWRVDAATVAAAAGQERRSLCQDAAWRGLVERAAAACPTCGGRTVLDRGTDVDTGADLIEECPDC